MKKLLLLSNLFFTTMAFSQADSLFASYNFNACNGADVIEPKARGTANGFLTYANDRFNNPGAAVTLNGAQGLFFGSPAKLQVSTGLTISAWIKPSTLTGQRAIVAKWIGSQPQDQYLLLLNGNKAMFAVGNPGTSANGYQGNITLTTTAWHHIVATWDTSGTHQIYVDGVLDISVVDNAFKTINSTAPLDLTIGFQSGGSRYFVGNIDDVKLFNQKLDASEVQTLYNETSEIQNNLISHYNFDANTKDQVSGNDPLAYGVAYAPDRNGNIDQAINISNDSTYLNLFDSYDGFGSGNSGKITYSFWLNFKTFTGANQIILAKSADGGCAGNDRQFLFRLNTQNKLDMTVYGTATAGSYGTLIGSTTFTTGQWYHVVFAYDAALTTNGGVDKIKMYS
ncbi:MAG: laminin G domain-containing protein [Bacteroidetes bacterium]|nr:laminin G domain-containing protein [Bacteroidota bacterium]